MSRPARRALAAALASLAAIVPGSASRAVAAPAPSARPAAPAPRAMPPATLGAYASALEGTWEFRSMTRPDGVKLGQPMASGVIVIDRGVVLAASYVKPSPERTVGSLWEGRMVLGPDRFEVIPEKGFRYDSGAKDAVTYVIPPRSGGKIEKTPDGGVRLVRDDGGSITFEPGGRRVQSDADGTVIVHERTSLVPRIPEDLPGRKP